MAQASQLARQTGRAGQGLRNRDVFLAQLEGVMVDDDPAQGVIDGRGFTHPDLGMQFFVPTGYLMQNGTRAVTIQGSGGQAQFTGGRYTGSIDNYIHEVLQELTEGRVQLAMGPIQRTTVNGIPASYVTARANSSSGSVDVGVFAYQWDRDTMYHFVTLTRGGSWASALCIDVQLAPADLTGGSSRHQAENHRCGDGAERGHDPGAGKPDAISGFSA